MGVSFLPPESLSDFMFVSAVITVCMASLVMVTVGIRAAFVRFLAFLRAPALWGSFVTTAYVAGATVLLIAYALKGVGL